MKETRKGVMKMVVGFITISFFIACCIVAIGWWIDVNRGVSGPGGNPEPANYVDPGKTICEVHGEILQIEKVSRGRWDINPNDAKRFPYSNKWDSSMCGNAPSEAIVQYCEQCRKSEFVARQREELERDLKTHNLWHELPQH
jgi:hypothetical protein